jgi:hypothetical protein
MERPAELPPDEPGFSDALSDPGHYTAGADPGAYVGR